MSVRDRIEAKQLAEKYAARVPRKSTDEIERERQEQDEKRRERLRANAAAIRSQNLHLFLLAGDATEAEIEVVKSLIEKESPQHLNNADVYWSRLLKLRVDGGAAIAEVLDILDADVRAEVEQILATKDAFAVTGADGGAGARAAVAEYFER